MWAWCCCICGFTTVCVFGAVCVFVCFVCKVVHIVKFRLTAWTCLVWLSALSAIRYSQTYAKSPVSQYRLTAKSAYHARPCCKAQFNNMLFGVVMCDMVWYSANRLQGHTALRWARINRFPTRCKGAYICHDVSDICVGDRIVNCYLPFSTLCICCHNFIFPFVTFVLSQSQIHVTS